MALIIKGDMPTRCSECRDMRFSIPNCPLHKHTQGNWYRIGKHPNCPILGEIPDEHGRLKDESVIIQKAEDAFCKLFPIDGKNKQEIASEFHKALLKAVFDAPTVVEATT